MTGLGCHNWFTRKLLLAMRVNSLWEAISTAALAQVWTAADAGV